MNHVPDSHENRMDNEFQTGVTLSAGRLLGQR